jgi:hypothetical protein
MRVCVYLVMCVFFLLLGGRKELFIIIIPLDSSGRALLSRIVDTRKPKR